MPTSSETKRPAIMWFRKDLRLADNRALRAACDTGRPVLYLYVLDEAADELERMGGASRWWLHHSPMALHGELAVRGGRLILRRGDPAEIVPQLAEEIGASGVCCSRFYDPRDIALEQGLKDRLAPLGCELRRYKGALLFEPERIETKTGDPYKVFTPFWKACRAVEGPSLPVTAPETIRGVDGIAGDELDDWRLLPTRPNWASGFSDLFTPGERGAWAAFEDFIDNALQAYADRRDVPAIKGTSRLSPHLHFGEISPRQLWHRLQGDPVLAELKGGWSFLREVGWREFSTHLLFHWPKIREESFRPEFKRFGWQGERDHLRAWQRGETGYPLVDAGMRELWRTGWMHNRVRMICASFLTKHLLIDWRDGARWFRDTLVDADLANNSASWQWVAGSGADAAPYFRIFNPMTQGEKFDPKGEYVRRWVPELARLPDKYLFAPFEAPPDVLQACGIELGNTYPLPLIDHKRARERALKAYQRTRGEN